MMCPPPLSDRPGMQEGKQEGTKKQVRSSMREAGMKKQARSSMREGMKELLRSAISFPLVLFNISTCNAILRNPRQRSNQFLVEDGKLPVDEAGGDDR